ncbi:hypothetical protein AOLI_G00321280 [Acnodon oligacanthus]
MRWSQRARSLHCQETHGRRTGDGGSRGGPMCGKMPENLPHGPWQSVELLQIGADGGRPEPHRPAVGGARGL